jgi:hypothetical protein
VGGREGEKERESPASLEAKLEGVVVKVQESNQPVVRKASLGQHKVLSQATAALCSIRLRHDKLNFRQKIMEVGTS